MNSTDCSQVQSIPAKVHSSKAVNRHFFNFWLSSFCMKTTKLPELCTLSTTSGVVEVIFDMPEAMLVMDEIFLGQEDHKYGLPRQQSGRDKILLFTNIL